MALINLYQVTQTTTNATTTSTGTAFPLTGADTLSVQCIVDVNTPGVKTCPEASVVVATSSFTIAAHGYTTGLKVGIASDGTLPAPLTATDFYVIVLSANAIQLASTLVLALAGTFIVLSDDGSAASTTTFTPTAVAGASVKLQKSNDGTNWTDDGSATSITADANVWLENTAPTGLWGRLSFTLTAGRLSSSNLILVKGWN